MGITYSAYQPGTIHSFALRNPHHHRSIPLVHQTNTTIIIAVYHNPIMDHAQLIHTGRVREERRIVAWPPFHVQHRHLSQATIIGCLLQPRECLDAQLFMDAIGQFWANARNGVQDALGSSLATEVLK